MLDLDFLCLKNLYRFDKFRLIEKLARYNTFPYANIISVFKHTP